MWHRLGEGMWEIGRREGLDCIVEVEKRRHQKVVMQVWRESVTGALDR